MFSFRCTQIFLPAQFVLPRHYATCFLPFSFPCFLPSQLRTRYIFTFFSLEHCPSILGIFHYLHVQQVEKRAPFYDLQKHSNLRSLKVVTPCFRVYTIFEDLHGSGHFRTEMQLFIGNSPIPKNFSVSASDDILIEVGIQRADSKLKVVLTDCWATPTNNSVDPLSFTFINNRYSKRHLQISCALR